ncbi:MAG: branched-chain amino acid ABC transporter substrate-binding protein [Thermoplasmatota archaeon]
MRLPRFPTAAFVAVLMLSVALAGCTGSDDGEDPVHMGVLMPLTGVAATLGEPAFKGAELAAKQINAAGGVDGRELILNVEDTQFPETEETLAAYTRLQGDGIQFIVGALASDSTAAVKERADTDKVVLMSPSSTRPSLSGAGHGYFYRTIANDDVQGPQAAAFVYEDLDADETVVMFQQTGYAEGLKDVFVPAYEDLGGDVTGDPISWTDDEASMASKAAEAAALAPEFIWISGQAPEIGTLIKELRDAGYSGDIMTSEAVEGDDVFNTGGSAIDGVYFTKSSPDLASTAYQDFLLAYQAEYGTGPGPFDVYAFDAVFVGAAAIEAVGNDGEAIKEWLDSNSVSGRVSTPTISFLNGDVTSGGYTLWQIDTSGRAFVPA